MSRKCPECGRKGNKEAVLNEGELKEEIYTCRNDKGFILPFCSVAQFTVITDDFGRSVEVDTRKY